MDSTLYPSKLISPFLTWLINCINIEFCNFGSLMLDIWSVSSEMSTESLLYSLTQLLDGCGDGCSEGMLVGWNSLAHSLKLGVDCILWNSCSQVWFLWALNSSIQLVDELGTGPCLLSNSLIQSWVVWRPTLPPPGRNCENHRSSSITSSRSWKSSAQDFPPWTTFDVAAPLLTELWSAMENSLRLKSSAQPIQRQRAGSEKYELSAS